MTDDWAALGRKNLFTRRKRMGVWGYRTDSHPSVEATALACLGLWCSSGGDASAAEESAVHHGADWLVSMQQADGSLGIAPSVLRPGWPTGYALLLWGLLGCHELARVRAVAWLLAEKGQPISNEDPRAASIVGHDPTMIGWPWIEGTHSWVEPTALAILALSRQGLGDHPRVVEGGRLLCDRSLEHGGWNYGNRAVFGRELRPQPGPTGLALVALSSHTATNRPRAVDTAIAFLRATLPGIHAPISLGWGLLGLRAWDSCPQEAEGWLARSFALHQSRRDLAVGLGLLLIAQHPGPFFRTLPVSPGARSL
jgi:hypothetical protein